MRTEMASPAMDGFFLGVETRAHPHILVSWPSDPGRWGEPLPALQHAVAGLVRVLSDHAAVSVAVVDKHGAEVQLACGAKTAILPIAEEAPMAGLDGPYLLTDGGTGHCGLCWSGRHQASAQALCAGLGIKAYDAPLSLDHGMLIHDGHGTVIISEEAALSADTNPELTMQQIEERLALFLGARHVIWLGGGLRGHGSLFGALRFVGPSQLGLLDVSSDDPNFERLEAMAAELHHQHDADHAPLSVVRIPAQTGEGMFSPLDCLFVDDHILVPPQADAKSLLALEKATGQTVMEMALDPELLLLGGVTAVARPVGFEVKRA